MRFLRQNTAVIITVGPFYDKTDGVTIETGLTITNEKITLTADTDAGSAPTNILDNVTGATSGTSNDLNYISGNDAGMMQMELAAANTNRVGRMLLSITDAANHVPVFHEFFVLPQAIYDWLTGVIVPLPANVTQLSGDSTAADNAESFFDGTGYAGTNNVIPAVTTVNGLAANVITATSINADAITAAKIAAGAIDAATFAADVDAEILSYLVDDATRIDASSLNTAAVTSIPAILADTGTDGVVVAAASKTGYTLAATTGLGNQTANITGNLSGSIGSVTGAVGSVTGAVGSVTGNVGGNVTGSIGSLAAQAKADVNAEVDSALNTAIPGSPTANSINERIVAIDAYGAPPSAATIKTAIEAAGSHLALILEDTGTTVPAVLGAPVGASLSADIAAVKSDSAAILTDTGTTLDGKIDSILTDTGTTLDGKIDSILADTGTDGVVVAAGSKDGYTLSNAGVDALWDRASTLTLTFEELLTRAYEMINNKMNVTDATGVVALRNIGDTATIATGSVTDDSTTTTRLELTWA